MPSTAIHTTTGTITPPRAVVPFPLTAQLAKAIKDRWEHGGNFHQLADALLDQVAHHIATSEKLDKRMADAIEQHLDHDPMEGDPDADGECTIEDVEAWRARMGARGSIERASRDFGGPGSRFTHAEASSLIGKSLKRPGEAKRYSELRDLGVDPPGALALVLNERKEAAARNAANWKGGAL